MAGLIQGVNITNVCLFLKCLCFQCWVCDSLCHATPQPGPTYTAARLSIRAARHSQDSCSCHFSLLHLPAWRSVRTQGLHHGQVTALCTQCAPHVGSLVVLGHCLLERLWNTSVPCLRVGTSPSTLSVGDMHLYTHSSKCVPETWPHSQTTATWGMRESPSGHLAEAFPEPLWSGFGVIPMRWL